MEPLSIIGLISNIAQFAEQAAVLMVEIRCIYRSGKSSTPQLKEAVESAQKTERMMEEIKRSPCFQGGLKGVELIDIELVEKYGDISRDLSLLLEELKLKDGKNKLLGSIQVAFKKLQCGQKVEELKRKLELLRKEVKERGFTLWK
jgi:hypothetical protein